MKVKERKLVSISEPNLEFGLSQREPYPKDGLLLYGPPTSGNQPKFVRYGVIGRVEGIARFAEFSSLIRSYVPAYKPERLHHSFWPGFEEAFGAEWPSSPVATIDVPSDLIMRTIRIANHHEAVKTTAALFSDAIAKHVNEEEVHPQFWFVVIPDDVFLYGRPNKVAPPDERVEGAVNISVKVAKGFLDHGVLFPEELEAAKTFLYYPDFHAQVKAALLGTAVVQVIKESTLEKTLLLAHGPKPKRLPIQDPATLLWNLGTAAFFKAQGQPWKLSGVREGVCYVGLVFKRNKSDSNKHNVCCGAQMFLDSGDGVVFRGAMGPWQSEKEADFHLSEEEARNLLSTVISSYESKHGKPPREIFLHGRTGFEDAEWSGYSSAVPSGSSLVGIKIKDTELLKLYRGAKKPIVRGSALIAGDYSGYLWTAGYVPRLGTYPGFEVPNPLSIEIARGKASLEVVLSDIMGLTKLNYNACLFGDKKPVTLRFADAVGDVLTARPEEKHPPLPFRYYL